MKNNFKSTFEHKVIYVVTFNEEKYKGLVKIGDATLHTNSQIDTLSPNCRELNQAALSRIKQYTTTIGLKPQLLYTELARRTEKNSDGSIKMVAFRDHDVHEVLKNSGISNVKLGNSREWFDIDLKTAIKAIDAVKNGYANLSFTDIKQYSPIIFRPEQEECIKKVVKHFKKNNTFLINAKMRYGKTFVALEIVKRCKFRKTIILTHRPVVNAGWYDDFTKIFWGEESYIYGSKSNGNSVKGLLNSKKNFIYFASIQDLRGSESVGGKFTKNEEIFNTVWDCVIVDEAHEGTTTSLGEETVKAIVKEDNKTKFLALSGTPFNILDNYDENSIYTWDYIMEQESKSEWDKNHFGDSNPYSDLPELKIYTYDLGDILNNTNYITFEDKAFNFKEFFRTWTGNVNIDNDAMPESAKIGDFVHEADIRSFLNLLTKEDEHSSYPFSNDEYRDIFRHSFWLVPGVREARALKDLMLKHPIFGNGNFNIVNVAGDGDKEDRNEEALQTVKKAIKEAGKDGYTITLSCGKLTTGVTIKEWTAVFMLAGSYSTSAANYLQTIFRVQSPCNDNGMIKEAGYVFDFAPDRTLKMISSAVQVSSRAGKTNENDKIILGKFLNYCPVIAVNGSEMTEYDTQNLLQQLKRAYADKVVRNGFDDSNLYNDELLKLDELDIKKFNELRGIIGSSKASPNSNEININSQGLTNEEYEEKERLEKKKKKDLTKEEKERLEELRQKRKLANDAISILRGISIRMPLLIYGADIPYDEEITLERFVQLIDDSSWEEFMPPGVTKKIFNDFKKYYDEAVFVAAGKKIRNIAKSADTLNPTERVKKIASLFSHFKNPDKETVLTPWRVVNKHLSDCLGGYSFWDCNSDKELEEPELILKSRITNEIFAEPTTKILEINSKSGLYPLYMTYSIYRFKCAKYLENDLSIEVQQALWNETVAENIFVICKTPMAKAITRRTLLGYSDAPFNAHYFDDLINILNNKPQQFISKVLKASYWKKGEGRMNFNAVVGNPPYQINDGGNKNSAKPIYQFFVQQAIKLNPQYLSMIMPARWYAGGKGLDSFRESMLSDKHLTKIVDYSNAKDCFPTISLGGGVCYFLWTLNKEGDCEFTNIRDGKKSTQYRNLNEFPTFVRYNEALSIIHKIQNKSNRFVSEIMSGRNPFGFESFARGSNKPSSNHDCTLYYSGGIGYVPSEKILKSREIIDKYKVMISRATSEHAGEPDSSGRYNVLSVIKVLKPYEICTDSYLVAYSTESSITAENFAHYVRTKFFRFLVLQSVTSISLSKDKFSFVPLLDFSKRWTDDELYKYFDLTKNEIEFIETMIKEK